MLQLAKTTQKHDFEKKSFSPISLYFQNFYTSVMTMCRALTGETWNGLMHEFGRDRYFFEQILELRCLPKVQFHPSLYDDVKAVEQRGCVVTTMVEDFDKVRVLQDAS